MKKILALALCILLLLLAFVGCGGAAKDATYERTDDVFYEPVLPEEALSGGSHYYNGAYSETTAATEPSGSVSTNRKLIRTVSLSVETEEYDVLLNDISARISACGGYLESMNADTRYSSSSRYATMTIRVPADRLDEFVNDVSGISNVVQRSENTEDVTLTYVDMESHAKALRTEQDRLVALLEKAENLKDILEIEDRLTTVRYELENMESQLRTYDNLVEYATVTLSISEVQKLTPTEEKGFWEKIGDGFMDSLNDVWEGLKSFFSFVVIALPYLLVIAVIVIVVLVIIFQSVKRSRKKAAKRTPAPAPQPQTMQRQPMPQPPVMPQQPPVSPEQK